MADASYTPQNANPATTLASISSSTGAPMVGSNQLSPFGVNLTQTVSVKLDKKNYLLWKNMILPIIRGHNLEGYILGTKVYPQEFIDNQITGEAGTSVEMIKNPAFCQWMSTDQLLMGWLYSSMTSDIAMRVMGAVNSSELWTAIEESYGVKIRSRIIFLTGELKKCRKGNMSIHQYLDKVKQLSDNLEIAEKTITLTDLITQVLAGLDEDYTPIVVQLNIRDHMSWGELQFTLMA